MPENRSTLAAVLTAPRKLSLQKQPMSPPGDREIRVRLQGCGVCASNIPVWCGRPWFEYPLEPGAPGHEGWGIVEETGAGIDQVRAGDRVALLSSHAFSEYEVIEGDRAVLLPPVLDHQPFPGEALGCAMNIFRRSDVKAGQTVAVVGLGFLGALLTSLAAKAGARVIALYRREFSRKLALKMGATETIFMGDSDQAAGAVRELTGGIGCDRVIEATGKQGPLDVASELCRERGRLIIAGYHQDGLRQVNMQSWNWRGLDVVNAHERDPAVYLEGMRLAVAVIAAGTLDPRPLYTHTFDLGHLADALEASSEHQEDFLKALVTYE